MNNEHTKKWSETIYILIPAYNAAESLKKLLLALEHSVASRNILVVDDGSYDETENVCRKFKIGYLKNARNRGKGAALIRGFAYLCEKNADWIITMDADGQHAVSDIPLFLQAISLYTDAGLIIGARTMNIKKMPAARIFSNKVTSAILTLICGQKILDSQCGFRAYASKIFDTVTLTCSRFEMESEVILKTNAAGFRIRFVPIQTLYCSTQSHISHCVDMYRWVRAVVMQWCAIKRRKALKKEFAAERTEIPKL